VLRRFLLPPLLALIALTTLSLIYGQDAVRPAAIQTPSPVAPPPAQAKPAPAPAPRDVANYSDLQKQLLYSAQRGADWLSRMNGVKGRFLYGVRPALKAPMDEDHFLHQIGAARALAQAARFCAGEERGDRYAARATQAVLALLEETTLDPKDKQVRTTTQPFAGGNRLAAAALLVQAVNELPAPQADLLDQSEQLCNAIRRQARPDGSFACGEDLNAADDVDDISQFPGEALYALALSQTHRPAEWKTTAARKAFAYYRPWWKAHKNAAFVPRQTAAWTEWYFRTHEPAFAAFVTEMNDWVCTLQYDQLDPRRQLWYGGFMGWADGKPVETAPGVSSAQFDESLAHACRVARELGDAARHRRYTDALERGLQFLTTLQYTDGNTTHFAPWYREKQLVGGFHASHIDGDLRIDYTEHAVAAMILYFEHVVR
jgi:hypothetical protein